MPACSRWTFVKARWLTIYESMIGTLFHQATLSLLWLPWCYVLEWGSKRPQRNIALISSPTRSIDSFKSPFLSLIESWLHSGGLKLQIALFHHFHAHLGAECRSVVWPMQRSLANILYWYRAGNSWWSDDDLVSLKRISPSWELSWR